MGEYDWLRGESTSWMTWDIDVPGSFRSDVTYLDLETVKVPTSPGFRLKATGEPLSRRWAAFLAGVSSYRRIVLVERFAEDEVGFLNGVCDSIDSGEVVYCATRKFDEMILKGRFTYARRGPEPEPFFPAMPGAEDLTWRALRPSEGWRELKATERGPDLPSKDVPDTYFGRGRKADPELVMVHLLRDVVSLILLDGEPDAECEAWCRRVLTDYDFAWDAVFCGED